MLAPLDIFDPTSYPTRRDEDWKYSDLSRVLRDTPAHAPVFDRQAAVSSSKILVSNGNYPDLRGAVSGGRLELHHVGISQPNEPVGHQAKQVIEVVAGQSLVLFETYSAYELTSDGARINTLGVNDYVAHTTLDFMLGEGASLTRIVILDEPEDAVSIRHSTVKTAPGSTFKQYVFSTGAKFQRFETHVTHAGHGAVVEMNGAYLLKDKRHFDLTTRVTHGEIDGVTNQLIKGLVRDTATAVFQGRILVERGADGTDARMRHQAMILNDGAHIRAKPELEIYADDVQCAHGNTIGALDEEALFFAMSRGIPEAAARAMLTQAFVMPVADLIADDEIREKVIAFLTEHTEGLNGL